MMKANIYRFRNCLIALKDCESALYDLRMFDDGEILTVEERARDELVTLCHTIASDFYRK